MGPLLFLFCIYDTTEWLTSNAILFADNANIWRTVKSDTDVAEVRKDLVKIGKWLVQWQMQIKIQKVAGEQAYHQTAFVDESLSKRD